MKKILFVFMIGLFLLTGCNLEFKFNNNKPGEGNLKSKYSEPIELNYDEFQEKLDNKDGFALLIFRTGCSHCEEFEPTLNKIIKDYGLEIYSINTVKISEIEYTKLENKTFVKGTPTLVVFKDGKYSTKLVGNKSKEATIEFLKENKIIK